MASIFQITTETFKWVQTYAVVYSVFLRVFQCCGERAKTSANSMYYAIFIITTAAEKFIGLSLCQFERFAWCGRLLHCYCLFKWLLVIILCVCARACMPIIAPSTTSHFHVPSNSIKCNIYFLTIQPSIHLFVGLLWVCVSWYIFKSGW